MLPAVFRTSRLILRPIAIEDADPVFDIYAQDPDVTRFLRPPLSHEDEAAYVAHRIKQLVGAGQRYAGHDGGLFTMCSSMDGILPLANITARDQIGLVMGASTPSAVTLPATFRIGAAAV